MIGTGAAGRHAEVERKPVGAELAGRKLTLDPPLAGVAAGEEDRGLGREGGQHSIDFYTESRIVHIALGDTHVPRFGA